MRGRPSPRIARETVRHVRRPNPKRSASHLAFLRSLPCCICGDPAPSEACHIRKGTDGGTGTKPSDRWCIPMCPKDHRHQHQVGEVEFFGIHGVDPYGIASHLWTNSGDQAAGERAVMRMVMDIMQRKGR